MQTQSAVYWASSFHITRGDIEYLFSQFLEEETPLSSSDLTHRLIQHRLSNEREKLRKQVQRGELFQPKASYKVGQKLVFPALDFAVGEVTGQRPGSNPDYGDFTVIEVDFDGKQRREFASKLKTNHVLNVDDASGQNFLDTTGPDVETIFAQHGESIIEKLEARLVDEEDAIFFSGKWFLRSLLAEVNVGQMHLAEAILDVNEGGPLDTLSILKDLELPKEIKEPLKEFSLSIAMSNDERFDNVGPAGRVAWFLRRVEPPEVLKPPVRLLYQPIEYDRSLLTEDLLALERELDDEFSDLEPPAEPPHELTLTLIYPHRRAGTLPVGSRLETMLPKAGENPRVRLTFVDGQSGTEFAGWYVNEHRYICGMDEFYRQHRLPIGGYVTIRATDDPLRLMIDFDAHRPRTEYIRLAVPVDNRLTFANFKRSIGAGYDEFLIVGAEDLEGVDAVWTLTRDKRRGLIEIMRDLIPELAKLNPQNAVHAKTLYSAVNIIRRCPPGPIFAALVSVEDFQAVGGSYWRLSAT